MSEKEIQKLDRSMADACMRRVKSMEQQNAELVADNEAMRLALEKLANLGNGDKRGNSLGNVIAIKALEQTPKQSLANIQADAIDRAIDTSAKVQTYGEDNKCIRVLTLKEHAKELREQAK